MAWSRDMSRGNRPAGTAPMSAWPVGERRGGTDNGDGLRNRGSRARHQAAVGVADQGQAAVVDQEQPDRLRSDPHDGLQRARWVAEQVGGGKAEQRIGLQRSHPHDAAVRGYRDANRLAPRCHVLQHRGTVRAGLSAGGVDHPELAVRAVCAEGGDVQLRAVRGHRHANRTGGQRHDANRHPGSGEAVLQRGGQVEHAQPAAGLVADEDVPIIGRHRHLELARSGVGEHAEQRVMAAVLQRADVQHGGGRIARHQQ